MTQIIKEEIKNSILAAAREEFLKNGFERASIRTIAAVAKTAKSNVYNYFADKDALFCAVLWSTVSDIRRGLSIAASETKGKEAESYTPASQQAYMNIVMEFVASRPGDILLLLKNAEGSTLASFRDEVLETFTDILLGWLKTAMPSPPSRLFVNCVAGFYLGIVERMLFERPSREAAALYMEEFLAFVYGGWKSVMSAQSGRKI